MRIGLTANPRIPGTADLCTRILKKIGTAHEVLLEQEIAKTLGNPGHLLRDMKVDLILAVGGDGTILRAFQLNDAEVLGINSGSLGFLAEIYGAEVDAYLARVLQGDYRIQERMRLRVEVNGQRLPDCLNEAVVHTAQISKIRAFEIRVDGQVAENVRADGVILATPTGSTSYAMSAGGPIVDPRVDAIIVAIIAPFKPSARPIVFPPASWVEVKLAKPKECLLVLDGQQEIPLQGTEDIRVTRSERPARFIRFRDDFYQRIEQKLAKP